MDVNQYSNNSLIAAFWDYQDEFNETINSFTLNELDYDTVKKIGMIVIYPFMSLALGFGALLGYAFEFFFGDKEVKIAHDDMADTIFKNTFTGSIPSDNVEETDEVIDIPKLLETLEVDTHWIDQNKKMAGSYFSLLECTDFSTCNLSDQKWDAYAQVYVKHADLFKSKDAPTVRVNTTHPKREIKISKNNLLSLSPKFRIELCSAQLVEKSTNSITMNTQDYSENAVEAFLKFIQTGKICLNSENVIDLYYLANENCIEILKQKCMDYLDTTLKLSEVLELINSNTLPPELLWLCLRKGSEFLVTEDLNDKDLKDFSDTNKAVIQELNSLAKSTYPPKFLKDFATIKFEIFPDFACTFDNIGKILPLNVEIKELSPEQFALIPKMCPSLTSLEVDYRQFDLERDGKVLKEFTRLREFGNASYLPETCDEIDKYLAQLSPINVTTLKLKGQLGLMNPRKTSLFEDVNDDYLNKLLPKLPRLRSLTISDIPKITTIPFQNLTHLFVWSCNNLKTLELPYVKDLTLNHTPQLANLSAPQAENIVLNNLNRLEKLHIPKAFTLRCSGIGTLTEIYVPRVDDLSCERTTHLMTICAPNAKTIKSSYNDKLTQISSPNATFIYCTSNPELKSISTQKRAKLHLNKCGIESLSVPYAYEIDISDSKLKELSLPNATLVYCFSNSELLSFNAPKASQIFINHCPNLSDLSIPVATYLTCANCMNLQTISMPEVETFICQDNPAITTIFAPKIKFHPEFPPYWVAKLVP